MKKIKAKFAAAWAKARAWIIGILVSIGLLASPLLLAQPKDFTWVNPTQRTDGTDLLSADIKETRIYCNGSLTVISLGNDEAETSDFSPGSYSCYATTVDTNNQESDPSNTVTFEIIPGRPNPPVLQVSATS